jgi:hypothetical protein
MNDFHKLRENFQKFLNEGPNDLIPGYPNVSYDKINDAHEGLKKALLDVGRASLASAAYSFGFSPEDVDARDVDDVGVMDQNWDRYLSADLDQIARAGFPGTGIRKEYRNEEFWKSDKLGGLNGLLYFFHHNAGPLLNYLEGQLTVVERQLKGEDLNDEKTKEKFKGVMLEIKAIQKAIEEVKKFKATLDATGGKPYSEFGKYDVAF